MVFPLPLGQLPTSTWPSGEVQPPIPQLRATSKEKNQTYFVFSPLAF